MANLILKTCIENGFLLDKEMLTLFSDLEEKDAKEMAANLYIQEKCTNLTDDQKKKVISIMEGIINKEEIDKKFETIVSTIIEKVDEEKKICDVCKKSLDECECNSESHIEKDDDKENVNEDSAFSSYKKTWLKMLKEGTI